MSDFDSLINNLIGENINSSKKETNIQQNKIEVYAIPVKIGKAGKSIDDGDKPNIIGTFLPNQYVNESHKTGHFGTDLAAPQKTPIYSVASGFVLDTGYYPKKSGYYVKTGHELDEKNNPKVTSFFAHCNASIPVKKGDKITQQTIVAFVDHSGNSKGVNHLHWEIKVNGSNINPLSIIGKPVGSLSGKQSSTKQSISSIVNFWNNLVKQF